jgi:acyl-CoA dehydrogenase
MDFTLSDEHRQIRDTVRAFVEREVMPYEQVLLQREIAGLYGASPGLEPDERRALQDKARAAGLWGIDTPEEHGGVDLDPIAQAVVHEELGRTIVDFEFGGSVLPALYSCDERQRERYLLPNLEGERVSCIAISEPGSGSDVKAMRTTATKDGADWLISGEKAWITRGDTADFAILFARTPEEPGATGITCFLVDRDHGWKSSPIPLMGSRDKVATMSFEQVRVPAENVLGEVGNGFAHAMGFIYRNRGYILSAKNLGTAARLIELGLDWARDRLLFGRPLAERDSVAFALAQCEMELRAAKLLVYAAADKATRGLDYRHEAYVNKVYVAGMVNRVVDRVLQIHGAMGYAKEHPIERWFRDLRVERIYDGSDEVNLANAARDLIKGYEVPGDVFAAARRRA